MILDGREVRDYIKQRHSQDVRSLQTDSNAKPPRLAIIREGATPATDLYLKVKCQYGEDLGIAVACYTETPESIMGRIAKLNQDDEVTAINVELPLETAPEMTQQALNMVSLHKDVEGLAVNSDFEKPTPKAIKWLLAAYNRPLSGRIVVVGQGKLVGEPLAREWAGHGLDVRSYDDRSSQTEIADAIKSADLIVSATGVPGIILSQWVKSGATVVDAGTGQIGGKLAGDLEPALYARSDVYVTPNPGGVGPMTVAALIDNVLLATRKQSSL